jgi:hypothetical protein
MDGAAIVPGHDIAGLPAPHTKPQKAQVQ